MDKGFCRRERKRGANDLDLPEVVETGSREVSKMTMEGQSTVHKDTKVLHTGREGEVWKK
jgi:hypothetical protein